MAGVLMPVPVHAVSLLQGLVEFGTLMLGIAEGLACLLPVGVQWGNGLCWLMGLQASQIRCGSIQRMLGLRTGLRGKRAGLLGLRRLL